jgi:hypothetical protein
MNIEKTSFWVGSAPCFYICEHIQNATTSVHEEINSKLNLLRLTALIYIKNCDTKWTYYENIIYDLSNDTNLMS